MQSASRFAHQLGQEGKKMLLVLVSLVTPKMKIFIIDTSGFKDRKIKDLRVNRENYLFCVAVSTKSAVSVDA